MGVEPSPDEEERAFISTMQKLDPGRALRVLMMMDLGAVLLALPDAERMRCIVAVHQVVDAASADELVASRLVDGELDALRMGLAKFSFLQGLDASRLPKQKAMFTPAHEALGAFGPEQMPSLVALLATA